MTLFIQNDATGAGAGSLDENRAIEDLKVIANNDSGLGFAPAVGNRRQVTYARSDPGVPPTRLDALVNTSFGVNPENVDIVILAVLDNFTFNDGTSILVVGGRALPPAGSGLPGASLNNTNTCLAIYDTTQNNGAGYCMARLDAEGMLDLPTPNPVILYHELSHAFRIVTGALLPLSATCDPSSPEENAAITDENDLRTQMTAANGTPAVLRDPGIHCGQSCVAEVIVTGGGPDCCVVAALASGSPLSAEVAALRTVRDGVVRRSETGFAFFEALHRDYYAFSPQICTLMERDPSLRPLVLEGTVHPLVRMFQLVERYALGAADAASLGEHFAAGHADREAAVARLRTLAWMRDVLGGSDALLDEAQRELAGLLSGRLFSSEHVVWALFEPIQMYESALRAHLDGCGTRHLGEQLRDDIAGWAGRVPIDGVWGALPEAELRAELEFLEATLLRAPEARAIFRGRLERRFGAVTAAAAVPRDTTSSTGGNR